MRCGNSFLSDDGFDAALTGEVVSCESLADALAIKAANQILCGSDRAAYKPAYLESLVRVLLKYGRTRAACLLSGSVIGLLSQCLQVSPDSQEMIRKCQPAALQAEGAIR
ncbi:hypothetical protein [Lacipirellula sp.]|uniref:hypothetical protein n=1 Tax=Lacipirellula sp. TaxID=2691419 RepID=UPI003D0A10A0